MKKEEEGQSILIGLTLFIFIFCWWSITILSNPSNIYLWLLILAVSISLYFIAMIKVAKHYNIKLQERTSDLSPKFVAFLELIFPGIGISYIGKQKKKNYIFIGLAIFSLYSISAFILITSPLVNYSLLMYSFIYIPRIITPIIAYIIVKKLKSRK
jgi:hypothetical protein